MTGAGSPRRGGFGPLGVVPAQSCLYAFTSRLKKFPSSTPAEGSVAGAADAGGAVDDDCDELCASHAAVVSPLALALESTLAAFASAAFTLAAPSGLCTCCVTAAFDCAIAALEPPAHATAAITAKPIRNTDDTLIEFLLQTPAALSQSIEWNFPHARATRHAVERRSCFRCFPVRD